jgi:hypothetical protein
MLPYHHTVEMGIRKALELDNSRRRAFLLFHRKKSRCSKTAAMSLVLIFNNNTDIHSRIHSRKAGIRRNRKDMDVDIIVRCLKGLPVLLQQKDHQSQNQMGVCHHRMVFYTSSLPPSYIYLHYFICKHRGY